MISTGKTIMTKKRPLSAHQPAYATSVADAPTELYIPPPAKAGRRSLKPLILIGFMVSLAGLFALLLGGAALIYYSDWVLPGVSTLGIDLGSRTTEDAAVVLDGQWPQRMIVLEAEGITHVVAPAELGIRLDTAVTAQRARAYGRSTESLWQWLKAGGQVEIAPAWTIDPAVAETSLNELAAQFAVLPQNAGVVWDGSRFQAAPPVEGRALDVPSTLIWLEQSAAQAVMTNKLQLPTVPVAPAITDVSGLVAEANQLLATAVTIQAYDPVRDETMNWVVAPEQWGQWLTPVINPSAPNQFDWTLDDNQA
ncbi:MAG: peptidoglycan binding domain-containing protein [Anaerolineales bacterium]|nr:peptidoglycan binding domain-containing protein [Anaerolineales bacterium]